MSKSITKEQLRTKIGRIKNYDLIVGIHPEKADGEHTDELCMSATEALFLHTLAEELVAEVERYLDEE